MNGYVQFALNIESYEVVGFLRNLTASHIERRKIDDKKIGSWTGKEYKKNPPEFKLLCKETRRKKIYIARKARKMRKKMKNRK